MVTRDPAPRRVKPSSPRAPRPKKAAPPKARRRAEPDSCARVQAELRHGTLLGLFVLEGIAQKAHDKLEQAILASYSGRLFALANEAIFPPAEVLAALHGYSVVRETHCAHCGQEGVIPGWLFVQRTPDEAKLSLRILHELAEALLRSRRRGSYTHADVWALTLMLAIPMRALRHASLARHIPRWAVRLRRALARTAERLAA